MPTKQQIENAMSVATQLSEFLEKYPDLPNSAEINSTLTALNNTLLDATKTGNEPEIEDAIRALGSKCRALSSDESNEAVKNNDGFSFADDAYEASLVMAESAPRNTEDLITLEAIEPENKVFLSTGHQFDKESLTEYVKQKGFEGLENPVDRQPFSERDKQTISEATGIELTYRPPAKAYEPDPLTLDAIRAAQLGPPGPTRSGPSWTSGHRQEREAQLFAAFAAQNEAFVNSNERITIKRLDNKQAEQNLNATQGQGPNALAIRNRPTPENTGTLLPFNNGNPVALRQTNYGKAQYQIDYTDVNGKTGSAVYDNRGNTPEIRIEINNLASIQAGVKAAKVAGWTEVGMYDDVAKEKREAVKKACEDNGLGFYTAPRPTPKPTKAVDDAQAGTSASTVRTPFDGMNRPEPPKPE